MRRKMNWLKKILFFVLMTALFTTVGLLDAAPKNEAVAKRDAGVTGPGAEMSMRAVLKNQPRSQRQCRHSQAI
jgi:hypothetical protein